MEANAVDLIVRQIYQKDALSVVSEAYRSFDNSGTLVAVTMRP